MNIMPNPFLSKLSIFNKLIINAFKLRVGGDTNPGDQPWRVSHPTLAIFLT